MIHVADGRTHLCPIFARLSIRIGTWTARMVFTVLPTGVPLVLGMPFFSKYEPQILWSKKQFVIHVGRTTHVLTAERAPSFTHFSQLTSTPVVPDFPIVTPSQPPAAPLVLEAAVTMVEEEVPVRDRREIEKLADNVEHRRVAGPPPPVPSVPVSTPEVVNPDVQKLLTEYADVFPAQSPLGLPPSRATDHTIDLEPDPKPPSHRIYRMSPQEET